MGISRTRGWRLLAPLLLAAAGFVVPCAAEEPSGAPAQDARLNDLTMEYTMRYQMGEQAEAILIAERALAEAEAVFGPGHERTAQVLNDLGHLYESQGKLDQAGHLHERALAIRDRVFNGNGPAVTQSLNNLARVYVEQDRSAEAKPLYERSLAITEQHVPPENPVLLHVLEPYAALLRDTGDPDAAARLEARIRAIHDAKTQEKGP